MQEPLVTINVVVWNGEKYLRQCLDAVKQQTFLDFEVNILDNNSSDKTAEIVEREYPEFKLIRSEKNHGMWPGQELLFDKHSRGEYVIALSVDIILDEKFVERSVDAMEKDSKIGALQAKVYQYKLGEHPGENVIDTCGFKIFRSRRLINIGHGLSFAEASKSKEKDGFDFDKAQEIFAVEGAVPIFKHEALEDIKIDGHFADPDFFWYGDDIDLAWRMRLFGWKQWYSPEVIAYHDRQTTKGLSDTAAGFIELRKNIPMFKRRLDYRNWILTVIKNDFVAHILKDLPYILKRHLQLWGYFLVFEPQMFLELPKIGKLLPNMLKRRRQIMQGIKVKPSEIHRWFQHG